MFEYFPGNFVWNLAVVAALNSGGLIDEVDRACRPIRATNYLCNAERMQSASSPSRVQAYRRSWDSRSRPWGTATRW